jgi:glycogen debranching enzyme
MSNEPAISTRPRHLAEYRGRASLDRPLCDIDGDGFVEYNRYSDSGLVNQGWKDSHDSIFHADGQLAQGPIALCEVQAYVFLAKHRAARMAPLDLPERAMALDQQADSLQKLFEAALWCEAVDLCFGLTARAALSRALLNAGHAPFAGIAAPDGHGVAAGLLDRDFFAGWGIRSQAA